MSSLNHGKEDNSSFGKHTPSPSSEEQLNEEIILDAREAHLESGTTGLKLAQDGHTVLVPQPTDDPNDPLNWSWSKKHILLVVAGLTAFLGDYTSAAGIPLIVVQGAEWHLSPNHVNEAGNLNVIMLGLGSVFWIIFSSWWGRAPVMFWSTLWGTIFTVVTVVAPTFPIYYGFRAVTSLMLTSFQVTGLACIKDMFFLHEHARKIGIWVAFFILSPYMSPLFGNFILAGTGHNIPGQGNWHAPMWVVFATNCFVLVLIVLLGDETWYNRTVDPEEQPERGSRLLRLLGVWQIKHHVGYFPTLEASFRRLVSVFLKPVVLPTLFYYMMFFMWSVGINITSSILFETPVVAGGYGFQPRSIGYLYFTPIVGAILGELFGHFFNDLIAARYVRTHEGRFAAEARLWAAYVGSVLMIPGLILVGQSLQKHLNYGVIVFGWGLYVFGVMTSSVAVTAYLLDSYPTASAEVAGLINFFRVVGGFTVGYFQQPWGALQGYGTSFGIQAAVVGAGTCIVIGVQVWGAAGRRKGGGVDHKAP